MSAVAVGVVILAAWLWWIRGARRWFTGPRHTIDEPPPPAAETAG
jgi:hypothetical protein